MALAAALFAMLLGVVLSGLLSRVTRVPVPLVQIALGAAIFYSDLSSVDLDPEVFFLVLLPPLLLLLLLPLLLLLLGFNPRPPLQMHASAYTTTLGRGAASSQPSAPPPLSRVSGSSGRTSR